MEDLITTWIDIRPSWLRGFILGFPALVFIGGSWSLFYTVEFVRELIGVILFITVLIFSVFLIAKSSTLLVVLTMGVTVLIFIVSPYTALYASIYVIILLGLLFVKGRLKEAFLGLFVLLTPAIAWLEIYIHFQGSFPSFGTFFAPGPSVSYMFSYDVISVGGLLCFILGVLGSAYLISFGIETRPEVLPIGLFSTLMLLLIPLPFLIPAGFVFRNAFYLSLMISVSSGLGILYAYAVFKKLQTRFRWSALLGKRLKSTIGFAAVAILVLSQTAYVTLHSETIDRSNEAGVVSVLSAVNTFLPNNTQIVADPPIVDKATGLLAPRPVFTSATSTTGGLLHDFLSAPDNLTVLIDLMNYCVSNRLALLVVSNGGYFLDGVMNSILGNYSLLGNLYNIRIYYVGNPVMLVDSSPHSIYLIIITKVSHSILPSVFAIPLPGQEISNNTRTLTISPSNGSINASALAYNNNSMAIWLRINLAQNVSLSQYPILFFVARGSSGTWVNVGFGNANQLLTYIGDRPLSGYPQFYLINLSSSLKVQRSGNYSYVYVALAGYGQTLYDFDISSMALLTSSPIQNLTAP